MSNNQISFNNQLTGIPNLEPILQQSRDLLQEFATRPDFIDQMQLTFGEKVDVAGLQETWASGNLGTLPEIEVFPASEINEANGAFAKETNTIYLSQELLNEGSSETITSVFLEEYGHYIDSLISSSDALGDEGALFSKLAQGENVSKLETIALKSESDRSVVQIDDEPIIIEKFTITEPDTVGISIGSALTPLIGKGELGLDILWDVDDFDIKNPMTIFPDNMQVTYGFEVGAGTPSIDVGINAIVASVDPEKLTNSGQSIFNVESTLAGAPSFLPSTLDEISGEFGIGSIGSTDPFSPQIVEPAGVNAANIVGKELLPSILKQDVGVFGTGINQTIDVGNVVTDIAKVVPPLPIINPTLKPIPIPTGATNYSNSS